MVIVCTEGRGWCEVDGGIQSVGAGQALVLPPGVAHRYRADRRDPWTLWWLHATGADLRYLLEPITGPNRQRVIDLNDPARAVHAMERVVQAMERDETWPSLMVSSGAAWNLLAQLGADRIAGPLDDAGPVQRAREYLLEHFAERVSVPEMADLVGLSASHFAAVFRLATGGGVLEYVKRIRMARARVLLVTTGRSVEEIAHAVGYSDAFYFSRQFRRVSGASPSQFRRQSRAEHGH